MTKANVVRFYKDLADLVEYKGRITGHSARVTGAMRMAYAQLSEWTIQMFGRWGSATVLRYVREALLGKEGGSIAEIVEGVPPNNATIDMIKDYVNQIVSAHASIKEGLGVKDAAMFEDAALTHPAIPIAVRG